MSTENGSNHIVRSHERKSVLADATLNYQGNEVACVVRDISIGGAKVEAVLPDNIDAGIELKFAQFGNISVDIAWQRNNALGLKFKSDPEKVGEILMAIALYD